jgi:hypothetical protein
MLLGLIFHESAKHYRSLRAWRADPEAVLPTTTDKRAMFLNATPVSNHFSHKDQYLSGPQASVVRHDISVSDNSLVVEHRKGQLWLWQAGRKSRRPKRFHPTTPRREPSQIRRSLKSQGIALPCTIHRLDCFQLLFKGRSAYGTSSTCTAPEP